MLAGEDFRNPFCSPNITFPPRVNSTVVRQVVCNANFTRILEELAQEFNVEVIQNEVTV